MGRHTSVIPEAPGLSRGESSNVSVPVEPQAHPPGATRAAVDLGEIHQAAVTTNTGAALVVSGRGIRTIKRWRNKSQTAIARKRSRCKRGSKRWRKLQAALHKSSARADRQIRDLRHKGTRRVVDFCSAQDVGVLSIGNPQGVRRRPAGRHHHQRMAQWEFGKDIDYLSHKCAQRRIESFTGTERGTSSRCPVCGTLRQKPKGRNWACKNAMCGFRGHRDLVGSANMHEIARKEKIVFPAQITYRRPGPLRVRARNEQPCSVAKAGTPYSPGHGPRDKVLLLISAQGTKAVVDWQHGSTTEGRLARGAA